jgi:hypothetical protein
MLNSENCKGAAVYSCFLLPFRIKKKKSKQDEASKYKTVTKKKFRKTGYELWSRLTCADVFPLGVGEMVREQALNNRDSAGDMAPW